MKKRKDNVTQTFTPAQIAAMTEAQQKAQAGTPTLLIEAFAPKMVKVADLPLQPVTMRTAILLQEIGSPLVSMDAPEFERVLDLAKALFVLTHPVAHVRAVIAAGQVDAAADELAEKIPFSEFSEIAPKLSAHFAAAVSTAIPHGEKEPDGPFATAPQARGTAGS